MDTDRKRDLQVTDNRLIRMEAYSGIKEIHKNWGWFLAVGIALIFLGTLAIGASVLVTLASMLFFGVLLVIGGIVQGVNTFKTRKGQGFLVNALLTILYVVLGVLLILHPEEAAITITLLMAVFYTVSGLFKIVAALSSRYVHWGWMLFSGIVSLALGLLIWSQWPISGLWIIGLFIGIDLIIMGWVWVTLALSSKKLTVKE